LAKVHFSGFVLNKCNVKKLTGKGLFGLHNDDIYFVQHCLIWLDMPNLCEDFSKILKENIQMIRRCIDFL